MPTDNNQQNLNNNQGSFPQVSDIPPLPVNESVPDSLKPVGIPFDNSSVVTPQPETQPDVIANPNPIIAPDLPKTDMVPPPVIVETPKKKNSLVTVSLFLLLISAIAIAIYFAVRIFSVNKLDSKKVVVPTEEPSVTENQDSTLTTPDGLTVPEASNMPASDSPDVIPTIPENSP